MSAIKFSKYSPSRGGHAPGDLRDSFIDSVYVIEQWGASQPEPTVELRGHQVPVTRIIGLLWNCSDILGGAVCRQICGMARGPDSFPSGATYAQAARQLKELVMGVWS
jgi:hypothetical protein